MSILSEDGRTHTKSSHKSGEHVNMKEKLKHVNSSSIHTPVKVIDNTVPSVEANKHSDIGTELHDALATPDCVVTKIVEYSNAKDPEVQVLKKVKARACNTTHRDHEFSLINTFPAGVKERNSYFQFSVKHTQRTLTHSTSPTDTNIHIGGQMAHPQAAQRNYQMANHMSPIDRTKLFTEEGYNIGTRNNLPKLVALADNKISKTSQIIGTKEATMPMPAKRKADIVDISPTSFGVRQVELAENADHVYNNLTRPIARRQCQKTVEVQEVVDVPDDTDNYIIIDKLAPDTVVNKGTKDDLIILEPKRLLELPIEENEKFPVSNEDCMHYNSIIELAYTKGTQKYVNQFP